MGFGAGVHGAAGSSRAAGSALRRRYRLEAAVCWRASPGSRPQAGWLSIGEHVLIVRHRIGVQAGLVPVSVLTIGTTATPAELADGFGVAHSAGVAVVPIVRTD